MNSSGLGWTSFLLFYVAVLLLLGAAMVATGALEYEVVSEGPVEARPNDVPSVGYAELSERDRATVDAVLDGERVVVRRSDELPGEYRRRGELVVSRDGTRYLIDRRLFFNVRSPFAAGSAGLALLGLGVGYVAVRREHL